MFQIFFTFPTTRNKVRRLVRRRQQLTAGHEVHQPAGPFNTFTSTPQNLTELFKLRVVLNGRLTFIFNAPQFDHLSSFFCSGSVYPLCDSVRCRVVSTSVEMKSHRHVKNLSYRLIRVQRFCRIHASQRAVLYIKHQLLYLESIKLITDM